MSNSVKKKNQNAGNYFEIYPKWLIASSKEQMFW